MALVKRILLFLLSIVFTIVLLIGATTSYAKDDFDTETMEPNVRYYTIEWVDVTDKNNNIANNLSFYFIGAIHGFI